jgi:GNAT superfamily N-acetyltransferase
MKQIIERLGLSWMILVMVTGIGYAGKYQDKEGQPVYTQLVENQKKFEEIQLGFVESFGKAYENIPLDVLKVDNKEQFLNSAFLEEIDDYQKPGVYQVVLETADGQLMGYFSMDNLDERKQQETEANQEYQKFPEQSAYIRQLYVKPIFQRSGLGSLMVTQALYEFLPNVQHIYVATRRVNEGARKLYEHCGFKESKEVLHGLPNERYMSFELHLSQQLSGNHSPSERHTS